MRKYRILSKIRVGKKRITLLSFTFLIFFSLLVVKNISWGGTPDLSETDPRKNQMGSLPVISSSVSLSENNLTILFGSDLYEGVNYVFNASIWNSLNNNSNYENNENSSLQLNPSGFTTILNVSISVFETYNQSNFSRVNVSANYTFWIKTVWRYRFMIQLNDSELGYTEWVFFEVVKEPPANPNNFVRIEIHAITSIKNLNEQGIGRVRIEGFLESSDYEKYVVRLNWINMSNTWGYTNLEDASTPDSEQQFGVKRPFVYFAGETYFIQINNTGEFISFETLEVYGNSYFSMSGIMIRKQFFHGVSSQYFGTLLPHGYDIEQFPEVDQPDEPYSINFGISPVNNVSNEITQMFWANGTNYRNTNYEIESQNFPVSLLQNSRVSIYAKTKNFGEEPVDIAIDLSEISGTFKWLWVKNNRIVFTNVFDLIGVGHARFLIPPSTWVESPVVVLPIEWLVNFTKDIQYLFPNYTDPQRPPDYEVLKIFQLQSRGELMDISKFQFELEFNLTLFTQGQQFDGTATFNLTNNFFYNYPFIYGMTEDVYFPYLNYIPTFFVNFSKMNIYSQGVKIQEFDFDFLDHNSSYTIVIDDSFNPLNVYFSLFNYDGLGLSGDLFKFYINGSRTDFGFNLLYGSYALIEVKDFFDITLYSSLLDFTDPTTSEYDIQMTVWNLVLNNNYTYEVELEIERNSVIVSQVIPANFFVIYRFLPNVEYEIRIYDLSGNLLDEEIINLDEQTRIVSFGFFSTELPIDPEAIIVDFMTVFWFFIGVVGFIITIFLFNRSFSVQETERQIEFRLSNNPPPKKVKKKKSKGQGGYFNYE